MPKNDTTGAWRWSDPDTAIESAASVNASAREYDVLRMLRGHRSQPVNGWEMSKLMGWPTITVVPRLAPLRRKGLIQETGRRPGPPPKYKSQIAYVISRRGLEFLNQAQLRKKK